MHLRPLIVIVVAASLLQGTKGSTKAKVASKKSPTPIPRPVPRPSPSPRVSFTRSCVGPYKGLRTVATSVSGTRAAWRNPDKDYICKGFLSGTKLTSAECTSDVGEPMDPVISDTGAHIAWTDTISGKVCWLKSSSFRKSTRNGVLCTPPYSSPQNLIISRDGTTLFWSYTEGSTKRACVGQLAAMRGGSTVGTGCHSPSPQIYDLVRHPSLSKNGIRVAWSTANKMCVGLRSGSQFGGSGVHCVDSTTSPQLTQLSESGEVVAWAERNGNKVCWMKTNALEQDAGNFRCVDTESGPDHLSLAANGLRMAWGEANGRVCVANLQLNGFGRRPNSTDPAPAPQSSGAGWEERPTRCWAEPADSVKFSVDATSVAYGYSNQLCVRDIGADEDVEDCRSGTSGSLLTIGPFIRTGAFWGIYISTSGEICTYQAGSEASGAARAAGAGHLVVGIATLLSLAFLL